MIGRTGVLHFCLKVQVGLSGILLLGAFLGQGFLLGMTQLPGGLMDVAGSDGGETHLRATILHVVYLASALALLVKWDQFRRPLALAHGIASVLTMPFATVLAAWIWWDSRTDETPASELQAPAGRVRAQLALFWAAQAFILTILAPMAYVLILEGLLWLALIAIAGALGTQYGTLRAMMAWEPKTKLQTYASPFPELPENP